VGQELADRMEKLAARIDARREELKIPGLALVVVRDDEVMLSEGFGQRDREKGLPVDEDTLFAIGSTTKAFTAMLVMTAVDEGKLSLDDHPRTCLPYFKLADEEADRDVTIRHLLSHGSGLMATDLGPSTGALTTKETIELAGLAKPTAKPGERYQYQNIMYGAAGECVATVLGKPYPVLLRERIFEPLGMTHGTTALLAKNLEHPRRALGYTKAGPDQTMMRIPLRPRDYAPAAGAISSTLRDIVPWLQVLLGQGARGNTRLVSERSFDAIVDNQQEITPGEHYGLGWVRDDWREHAQLSHGGGLDGFASLISFLPDERVGFALFSNGGDADIRDFARNEVYGALLDDDWGNEPEEGAGELPPGAEKEVGTYGVVGGLQATVELSHGKLTLSSPKQPTVELIHIEGREYRQGPPLPEGFFATFRSREDGLTELLVDHPNRSFILPALRDADYEAIEKAGIPDVLAELMGTYEVTGKGVDLEVGISEGRVALLNPKQPPAPLLPSGNDEFTFDGPWEGYWLEAVRVREKLTGLELVQPNGTFELVLRSKSSPPKIGTAELRGKMRRAAGSKKLAKIKSMKLVEKVEYVNQGLTGRAVLVQANPGQYREEVVLMALGRTIGTKVEGTDGKTFFHTRSWEQTLPLSTRERDDIALSAVWDPLAEGVDRFGTQRVLRSGEIEGEPVAVLETEVKTGGRIIWHVSTKSWLVLKKESFLPKEKERQERHTSTRFEDYRSVKGVMIPHRRISQTTEGEVIETVESVEMDPELSPDAFVP